MDSDLRDLLSAWQGEDLDAVRRAELLEKLRRDEAFRRAFVEEIRLLGMLKAVQATEPRWLVLEDALGWSAEAPADRPPLEDRVMQRIQDLPPAPGRRSWPPLVLAGLAGAAAVWLVVGLWWLPHGRTHSDTEGEVAWLLNAQNCRWADAGAPAGDLRPGKVLRLEQGLAEVCFRSGACVILQGPATLQLHSANGVRLLRGRLAARVPEAARGFEVLSAEGTVVDLGTEFGVNIAEDGSAQVHVFRGEVQAQSARPALSANPISVREKQSVRIGLHGVSFEQGVAGAEQFVRAIIPPPLFVPRRLELDFRQALPGTLADVAGLGTGLTHRLPGTGHGLPTPDPNLRLNREAGRLELTTTENDIHRQVNLAQGEYPGVRLADLGFTGTEDFSVTAVFLNTPSLRGFGQFGLYAGVKSNRNIRGGLLIREPPNRPRQDYYQFFVHNNGPGPDSNLQRVGLVSTGDDLQIRLQRVRGKYALTLENHTTGESSTLVNRHPKFLDGERDLYVGLFGATPGSREPRTIFVKQFKVTVWAPADKGPHGAGKE